MGNARHRITFGLSAGLLGLLMFVVASAFVVAHDYPKWLAAAVGAFAFPMAPGVWQLVAERKRAKRRAAEKTPRVSSLTGGDRYWLRLAVVALVVIGPMIAIGRFEVVRAVWHHGLWFVPTPDRAFSSDPSLSVIGAGAPRDFKDQDKLLSHVPTDAELVIVLTALPPEDKKTDKDAVVMAWGARKLAVVTDLSFDDKDGSTATKVDKLNAERDKLPWLPIERVVEVPTTDGSHIIASEGWQTATALGGKGPSLELRRELSRAPKTAVFVAALVPHVPSTVRAIRAGALWAITTDDKLVIEARVEATDTAAAEKVVDRATEALNGKAAEVPAACHDDVAKIMDHTRLVRTGAVVTARLEIAKEQLFGLVFCAIK